MSEKIEFFYVPIANPDDAEKLARTLVEEGLCACANIVPQIRSVYRWEGAIRTENETLVILKTRASLASKTEARIQELHGYDCPCIARIGLSGLNKEYERWLLEQT